MEMNFDANIVVDTIPQVGFRASGRIYDDKAKRFADGTEVLTSTVQEIGQMWFRTRNTVYKIITPVYKQMTTHELAKLLLKYEDLPLFDCEYDGDVDSDDYEMVLSPVLGVDFGVVAGTAVISVGEERIGFEELADKIHKEREALGRLNRERAPVEIIEIK